MVHGLGCHLSGSGQPGAGRYALLLGSIQEGPAVDARRAHAIAFFDQRFKGKPQSLLVQVTFLG